MFNQIFKQPTRISRHLNAPLLEDRLRYLIYRSKQETAKSVLCQIAHFQLILIKHLHLEKNKIFTPKEIKTSGKRWANHKTQQGCIIDKSIVQRRCENFIRYERDTSITIWCGH